MSPRPIRDAAEAVETAADALPETLKGAAREMVREAMQVLSDRGIEFSAVVGGPLKGVEIPIQLRLKIPT